MLSRADIEERLKEREERRENCPLCRGTGHLYIDDFRYECECRGRPTPEEEALETAKWLGERLELCIVNEEYQTPQEWSKRDEARAWLEGEE